MCLAKSRRQSVSRALNQLNRPSSVADRSRACVPRGGRDGCVSPTPCPTWPEWARAGHYHPQRPPDPSRAPFFFSSAPPSSLRATAAATVAQARRRRHYRYRLAPPCPFATAASPLPSPSLTAPACAHQQRPVSRRAAYDLAGASPRAPSPWPEHHRPPLHALASALRSSWVVYARPSLSLLHRGLLQHAAVVPPRRAAIVTAVVASSDEKATDVAQSMRQVT